MFQDILREGHFITVIVIEQFCTCIFFPLYKNIIVFVVGFGVEYSDFKINISRVISGLSFSATKGQYFLFLCLLLFPFPMGVVVLKHSGDKLAP